MRLLDEMEERIIVARPIGCLHDGMTLARARSVHDPSDETGPCPVPITAHSHDGP